MKLFKRKGVLLLVTLCITVIMGIFLMGVVQSLAGNIFFTKKVAMEIKSYWAANAGIEYANTMLARYPKWPAEHAASGTVGGFSISGGGSDAIIHGSDSSSGADFYIPFSSTSGAINSAAASKGLDFYSYNNSQKATPLMFRASPLKNKTVKVPAYGIYIASEGRAGAFKSGIEELATVAPVTAASSSGAVYAGASISASGLGSPLKIQTKTNGTNVGQGASIVSKGGISVSTTDSSNAPVDLGGGHLYVSSGGASLNGTSIKPKSFLNKYDVSVLSSASIKEPSFTFPPNKGNTIPAGTFAWVQMPTSEEENIILYTDVYMSIYPEDSFRSVWYDKKLEDVNDDGTSYRYGDAGGSGEGSEGGENAPPSEGGDTPVSTDSFADQYAHFIAMRVNNRAKRDGEVASELLPGYSYYEPCFIPDDLGVYTTDDKGEATINLTTLDYAYAKEIMSLRTQLKQQTEAAAEAREEQGGGLLAILGRIFGTKSYKAFLEAEEARLETQRQIEKYESDGAKYEFVKVDPGSSGADSFYCLVKASQNNSVPFKSDDLKSFGFTQTGKKLTLSIKESVQVDGNFNFATLERTSDSYKLSENKRGIVKMGDSDSSGGDEITICAKNGVNISGIITGRGQLLSERGNINIEAGADVDGGEENYLAVYAKKGDININQISATSSVISGDGGDGKKVTFSAVAADFVENVLGINTDDQRLCNQYLTGEAEISMNDLLRTYTTNNGNSYSYLYVLDGFDVTASSVSEGEDLNSIFRVDRVRAKIMEYLKAQSTGDEYSVASNFKGILAANRNINIAGGGQSYGLCLEGVIVAQKGVLNISGLNQVKIVYDPSLSSIMANLPGAQSEPVLEIIGVNRI